jgi:hypothetical protein
MTTVRPGKSLGARIIAIRDIWAGAHSCLRYVALILAFVGTLIVFVPFYPVFPVFKLDSSWAYAMNEAVFKNMVFGRDVIFTCGPLASVYTHMYHPATDSSMLGVGIFLAATLFAGCLVLCRGSYLILLLPLIISQMGPLIVGQLGPYDPLFFILPFVLLLVVTQGTIGETKISAFIWSLIFFIFTAVALLPLIKASFSVLVVVCGGLAIVLIARRSIAAAALLAIWGILAIAIAWCFMGQPLSELSRYFLTQRPIISGYGEAMWTPGPVIQVVAYLVCALVVWVAFIVGASARLGKLTISLAFGLAVVLFVGFKEGFVRHDASHALVAGWTLLLSSFVLLLTFRSRLFAVTMIVGIGGWATINSAYMDIDPVSAVSRFTRIVSLSWEGLLIRVSNPAYFPKRFENARAEIRRELPLPVTNGIVDLYPFDLSAVFAAGQKWSPRPVIQSYSAYTPYLAELNRAHLEGDGAPDRIYFSVLPLDGRYPSLDDGASWPELIARYRLTQYLDEYAVMEKRPRPIAVDVGPVLLDERASLGEQVLLPKPNAPIWAKIDVGPTLIGRVVSALYKLPPLYLVVKFVDGSTEQSRFIPGEARAGFLLSPTVRNAMDFTTLLSARREEFFKDRVPISIEILAGSKLITRILHLWNTKYSIVLSELKFQPDERAASGLYRAGLGFRIGEYEVGPAD